MNKRRASKLRMLKLKRKFNLLNQKLKRSILFLPSFDHEKKFLASQDTIRKEDYKLLNEAMLVLDIIDSKTASLLSYISISFATLTFLTPTLVAKDSLDVLFLNKAELLWLLFLMIFFLLIAIVLCLSCLNIIGAHTIKRVGISDLTKEKYEDFIIKLTLNRRTRYLIAHRISMVSAVTLMLFFMLLLIQILIS